MKKNLRSELEVREDLLETILNRIAEKEMNISTFQKKVKMNNFKNKVTGGQSIGLSKLVEIADVLEIDIEELLKTK